MKWPIILIILFCLQTHQFFAQQQNEDKNCLLVKNEKTKTMDNEAKNVLGGTLALASKNPLTGFYRNGFCTTGKNDAGSHVVAAVVTEAFLNYSRSKGNDLITPNKAYDFPGLKPGDVWCLCALRWKEALKANVSPPVILEATHEKALQYISLEELKKHATK